MAAWIDQSLLPIFESGINMRKRTQKGFTLVELVVVIVILGILAAVALPRFVGLQTEARYAKLQAVTGAIKGASAMARGAYLVAQSASSSTVTSISMEGSGNVALTNGYPTSPGIVVAANLSSIDGITITPGTVVAGTPVVVTITGAASTCKVTYTEAASGSVPTVTLPDSATAAC